MAVTTWYVWVTASSSDYAELLCSKLIRRGFTVGPLGRQLVTSYDDCPSCVVAFSLHRVPRTDDEEKEYNATGIHAEVCDVIKHVKGKFWSLVVAAAGGCTWNVGNERLSKDEKDKAESAKKVN